MFKKIDYTMVAVTDMDRSADFYHNVLGLELRFKTEHWTEFSTGATTLALHSAKEPRPEPADPDHVQAGTCAFGFYVEDLKQACKELESKNVTFLRAPTHRENKDLDVELAVFLDPDGLPIGLTQVKKKPEG